MRGVPGGSHWKLKLRRWAASRKGEVRRWGGAPAKAALWGRVAGTALAGLRSLEAQGSGAGAAGSALAASAGGEEEEEAAAGAKAVGVERVEEEVAADEEVTVV